jgi:hypothetical protein
MGRYGFGASGPTFNGIPLVGDGIPVTPGNVLFVDYGAGSDGINNKTNAITHAFKTVDKAYDVARTNKDDVIALVGNSSHALTEMLTVAKNRVHFVGLDGTGRMYGQNAKISLDETTAATDIGTILNTGIRNSFTNIKFTNANTVAQGLYCFVEGGEYTVLESCEIYKETDLDETAAAELVMNGDSAQVRNCTIGSLANALSGDVVRANVLVTAGLAGAGKVSRDVSFEHCYFWKKASHVNNRYVYGANATDVERMFLIRNSVFFATKLSTAVPAQCVAFGAQQTQGFCLIDNCTSINNTKLSTTTGVYVSGPVPTYATSGIAVAA